MAQRYQSGVINIGQAAVTVVHNLTGGTPTEYGVALSTPGATQAYFLGVSQTNVVVAAGAIGAVSGNVFCSIPHSIIQ